MKIEVDSQTIYYVNVKKLTDDLQTMYENLANISIPLAGNKSIDFNRKSLIRLVLKQLITPIVIPMLDSLFTSKGEVLVKAEKHADLIDYCVVQLLAFVGRHEDNVQLIVATKTSDTGVKTISTISTTRQDNRDEHSRRTGTTKETQETAEGG